MEKRVVILGAGESGCGAAVLAKKLGFDVFVSDFGTIADKYKQMLDEKDILVLLFPIFTPLALLLPVSMPLALLLPALRRI